MQQSWLILGSLLLLIGLVPGLDPDRFPSPEITADAYVAGVLHGMLLMIPGLAWPHTRPGKPGLPCVILNTAGLYGIWATFVYGAVTGEAYPGATTVSHYSFQVFSWILITGMALFMLGLLRRIKTS